MKRTLAAVDLGAQSGRVAVGRFDGSRLHASEVHRFANEPLREDGRLRWDFARLYDEALAGLRLARRDAAVESVAVDSWAIDFGLLDASGRLLANPVHYRDAKRAAAAPEVYAAVPPRELYDRTGIQLLPINTLCELRALSAAGDGELERADTLLLIPDLFHHRLCGSRSTELTNATTTQCLDAATGAWATDLLERLDLPTRLFAEVVPPGTVLGPLDPQLGLGDADVVAVATHDTGSAVAAIPFRHPGSAYLSVGTWSLVGVELDRPRVTDETFAANLTNEGGVAGTYRLLRNVTGLWLLHECRRSWAAAGRDYGFEELLRLAADAPALRTFVDPDAPQFAEPGDMPARIAAFCRDAGEPEPATVGETVRCILESLALTHAEVVDLLADATGSPPPELHLVGGGARNELLCAWTGHATGLPVLAGPAEATLAGNLLVQLLALGELESLEQAREVSRASFAPTTYEPVQTAEWQEAREHFAGLRGGAGIEVPT